MFWSRQPADAEELTSVLKQAEDLATSYGHDYIGVEHIFLTFRSLPPDHCVSATLAVLPIDFNAAILSGHLAIPRQPQILKMPRI